MILIVDDMPFICHLLIEYLADVGYPAVGAADGREALHSLRTQPIQLVLLDINMPVMNGWELLQAMHADPTLAGIPVVLMSAAEGMHQIALKQGAIGYLPKPLDLDKLLGIVQSHVREQPEA